MATAMWRMNGRREKMSVGAALLLLGVLLLSDGVMCQEDPTDAAVTDAADAADAALGVELTTDAADSAAPPADSEAVTPPESPVDAMATVLPELDATIITDLDSLLNGLGKAAGEELMTTAGAAKPSDGVDDDGPVATVAPVVPQTQAPLRLVAPVINCKEKEAISDAHLKAVVKTSTCEETKAILEASPAAWCADEYCRLDVSQDGNNILVASPDATSSNIEAALLSENIREQLGVSEVESTSSSSGASVFVGVLLTGLLLATGLIGGYCLKNRRATGDKGIRLAEEAYPVDGETQGNTLVSVAPLNPPPETQEPAETTEIPEEPKETAEILEKPSANGETPEEVKSDPPPQPPPTNGHSTPAAAAAKTADTEL